MKLGNEPEEVYFQDVAVGDRVYVSPKSNDWWERIKSDDAGRNARAKSGLKVRVPPLKKVWRKDG
jgi:hypothetical protein